MINSVSVDTLQGVMLADSGYLPLVVTVGGKDFVVALKDHEPGRPTSVDIKNGNEVVTYAYRRVAYWRRLGDFSLADTFPVAAFSSLRRQFIVLDEKLGRRDYRRPIVVDAVRRATEDEQFDPSDSSLQMQDDELMKFFAA